jgi:hypothetical protein
LCKVAVAKIHRFLVHWWQRSSAISLLSSHSSSPSTIPSPHIGALEAVVPELLSLPTVPESLEVVDTAPDCEAPLVSASPVAIDASLVALVISPEAVVSLWPVEEIEKYASLGIQPVHNRATTGIHSHTGDIAPKL